MVTDAFTPDRLELLQILASQAAISIENTRLYATLEDKMAKRTRQLDEALSNLKQEHKKLKTTQSQLIQAEKMVGLGTIALVKATYKEQVSFEIIRNYAGRIEVRSEVDQGSQFTILLPLQ